MVKDKDSQIVIVNAGGQYCHLIARRVREAGVQARICSPEVAATELQNVKGIIISGGPSSVYDPTAPLFPDVLFRSEIPILGICYGHQVLAEKMGGRVEPGIHHEYGATEIQIVGQDTILQGIDDRTTVWMSHGDEVRSVPSGFQILAKSENCPVVAMANVQRKMFGIQFHPEVTDTPCGSLVLDNFLFKVCKCERDWHVDQLLASLEDNIRRQVGDRHVLFFVSGGVDSTVAFTLCTDALSPEQVTGVFVDTGFMRKNERQQIKQAFDARGWHNIQFLNESQLFVDPLTKAQITDPEEKRRHIGESFLEVQRRVENELGLGKGGWILGQGTIYPDTIESGGSSNAALIKTHHNRVPAIEQMMREGLILEPLRDFYKDEVRDIGRRLGLPESLVGKQPFPGPGLAVRCLCSEDEHPVSRNPEIQAIADNWGLDAWVVPIRTVGVQGDHRSYSNLVILSGLAELETYAAAARKIVREVRGTNRVAFMVSPQNSHVLAKARVIRSILETSRLDCLREADALAHHMLEDEGLMGEVWQFPVVQLPIRLGSGETIALRPVSSSDAMTARHAQLPIEFIRKVGDRLLSLPGVDMVLYDVTDKPPATIEWE